MVIGQVYPNENGDVMAGRKMSTGEEAWKREAGYDGSMVEKPATAWMVMVGSI
jgi:hypothetical protein